MEGAITKANENSADVMQSLSPYLFLCVCARVHAPASKGEKEREIQRGEFIPPQSSFL